MLSLSRCVLRRCDVLVASYQSVRTKTQRVRKAWKLNVPIVSVDYIDRCIAARRLLPAANYPVLPPAQRPAPAQQPAPAARARAPVPRPVAFARLTLFPRLALPQPRWLRALHTALHISKAASARRRQTRKRRAGARLAEREV